MKLIVQKRDSGIEIGGDMESLKEVKEDRKTLIEDGPFVYRVAIALLRVFPRFKEITINTELTDNGEDNH
jgi:hypothetical protein